MMSSAAETTEQRATVERSSWQAGVVGGIVGAAVMAGLILAMNRATLAVAIPSLYSLVPPPNLAGGLFVHISHGAVLGVIFAAGVGAVGATSTGTRVALGAAWGVVVWVLFAVLLMPAWLSVVGSPASPPLPNFAPPSLLWHLAYGLTLGLAYDAVTDTL